MNNKKIQDERVILEKRKIGSDAFGILLCGLLVSVLIQQFVLQSPFSQYAAEWILFLAAAFYVVIRNIIAGNNLFGGKASGQKMVVINSIVSGVTVAVVVTTLNTFNYGYEKMGGVFHIMTAALICFVCSTLVSFVLLLSFYMLEGKRQKQLEEKYSAGDGEE